jgi:hypothetical protein
MSDITVSNAALSILTWNSEDLSEFNSSDTNWVASNINAVGTPPNTPDEVLNFLGTKFSSTSYQVTLAVKEAGGKLGFALDHDPCE